MISMKHALWPLAAFTLLLVSCTDASQPADQANSDQLNDGQASNSQTTDAEGAPHGQGPIILNLTATQIKAAGIELAYALRQNGSGALTLPATIEADPQSMQIVSAAIAGRIVSITRHLGQPVKRGDILAIIESPEAASLNAAIEAARARLSLAESNLKREQRLFDQKVTPEQDLILARTVATEARIALRLAQQQLSATGSGTHGGALNRIAITSPLTGAIIAREATLGQPVLADAELFRIANLARVAVTLALSPADAGKVQPGTAINIVSGNRKATGRISFVSPVLDETTRQATVIAIINNQSGQWRVGENVMASMHLSQTTDADTSTVHVPQSAVQTIDNQPSVFVRVEQGFRVVPVSLGNPNGDLITITSGLKGDEQVANANSFTLKAELQKGEAEHDH